jgi:hypothetical protein
MSPVSTLAVTFGSSVSVGNLIVVCVNSWATSTSSRTYTCSDGSNTYSSTTLSDSVIGSGHHTDVQIFYSVATTGGALTVTITPSAACYATMGIEEYSNPGSTITLEAQAQAAGGGSSATSISSGNMTFTSGDLLIAVTDNGDVTTVTAGTNSALGYSTSAGGGTGEPMSTEYWLNGSGSPLAGTFTFSPAGRWNCSAAAFLATPPAGASPYWPGTSILAPRRRPAPSGPLFTSLYG